MSIECGICGKKEIKFLFKNEGNDYYRCSDCGLEKIYPPPPTSDIEYFYGEEYYRDSGCCQEGEVRSIKVETAKILLDMIPDSPNKRILDCGCAAGYFLEAAEERGFMAYGIEVSEAVAEIAQKKFLADRIYKGMFEDALFPKDFFYSVIMNGFLEHVREPARILHKARELLEPGGYLLITTPDTGSFSYKIMRRWWPHYRPEHLFLFNKNNIKLLLGMFGFRLLDVRSSRICVTLDYLRSKLAESHNRVMGLARKTIDLLPVNIRLKKGWFSLGQMSILAQKGI